jgi:hypothetical protein
MTARFSDEYVSGALQYETDAKVRIVFFFFEARLYKSAFQSDGALLFDR